jgi:cytoskeleton protein RodZ
MSYHGHGHFCFLGQNGRERVESFGARLKREREKKGVTLDDISLTTKIGTRLLRALEDEHFDQLPGGIFNKGFVRAYARHLGLDEDQAIADYLAASGDAPPAKTVEPQIAEALETRSQERANPVAQIPWGVLAVALLVVAFGFAIWGFYSSEKQREAREAAAPASHETAVPTAVAATSTPAKETSTGAAAAPGSSEAPRASSSAVLPGEFVVLIKAHDDSWLSVTADGQHIIEETLVADSEKSVHAKKSIEIRAGNVGGVDFWFNGKKLPSQGDQGEVKTLTFNEEGLQPPKPEPVAPAEPAPQPQ